MINVTLKYYSKGSEVTIAETVQYHSVGSDASKARTSHVYVGDPVGQSVYAEAGWKGMENEFCVYENPDTKVNMPCVMLRLSYQSKTSSYVVHVFSLSVCLSLPIY